MRFRRIDDETVRCIVSKEDMMEYGIVLEDFFKNRSKIHDFLHMIVEKAEKEVGYEPKEGMLSMQIMPLSPNTLAITFSEAENIDYDEMMEKYKGAYIEDVDAQDDEDDEVDEEYSDDDFFVLDDDSDSQFDTSGDKLEDLKKRQEEMIYDRIIFSVNSIEDASRFCKMAGITQTVKSDLYYIENKDVYYMVIHKGRLSNKLFRHLLILATEFSAHVSDDEIIEAYLNEHSEKLIVNKAYLVLKKYA